MKRKDYYFVIFDYRNYKIIHLKFLLGLTTLLNDSDIYGEEITEWLDVYAININNPDFKKMMPIDNYKEFLKLLGKKINEKKNAMLDDVKAKLDSDTIETLNKLLTLEYRYGTILNENVDLYGSVSDLFGHSHLAILDPDKHFVGIGYIEKSFGGDNHE